MSVCGVKGVGVERIETGVCGVKGGREIERVCEIQKYIFTCTRRKVL